MKHRVIGCSAGALAAALIFTQAALAQDPAPGLQDLVGARGSSGEQALKERGYQFVKGEKSGGNSYTNWRHARSGQCVIVRTAQGRYQSLVTAPAFDCQGGAAESAPAPAPGGGHFATVCGATVEGKPYRYKCTVEGAAPGGPGKTVLRYPDQTITLNWRGPGRASAIFEGMKPQTVRPRTAEGTTEFVFEDKTYFYVSDRGAARWEVQNFRE